jgi:hypothetical protein
LLPGSGERLMGGIGERLGTPEALLRVQRFPAAAVEERLPGGTHRAVVARVLDHLAEAGHPGAHLLGGRPDRHGCRRAYRAPNLESGLEGLSGVGNDMRTVEAAGAGGNERARLALEVFVHRLSKAIAGLVVGLQRLDALVFTGGIGENSAVVRSLVLSRLGFLGLAEDVQANAGHGRRTGGRISAAGPVLALVVPTDEELMIARDTARVIAAGRRSFVHATPMMS